MQRRGGWLRHARACGYTVHAGVGVWVLRACGGDLPTRCPPPFASSKVVEEEVDEKVRARALALAQQPSP